MTKQIVGGSLISLCFIITKKKRHYFHVLPILKDAFCDITSLAGQIYGKWLVEHTPYKAYSSNRPA